jgi:uncharacterized membrane protein
MGDTRAVLFVVMLVRLFLLLCVVLVAMIFFGGWRARKSPLSADGNRRRSDAS